ncbi:DUF3284 domain-containing protein [Lacticaseibacillus sp. GG6-2]
MQITIAIKAPQMFYFARLVELHQLDIQAATGKNVSLHRLPGYTYRKTNPAIGIKILTCEPGRHFAFEMTKAGETCEISYRLQRLSSQCTSLTYSERVITTSQPSWRTHWQTWWRRQRLLQEVRQVARSYAILPQLKLRVAELQPVLSEES